MSKRKVFRDGAAAPRAQGWLYISLSFSLTPGAMLLFYGGRLTANYLLSGEVNTPEPVEWEEKQANQIP